MPGHGRIKIFNFLRLKGMRSKLRPPVQFVRLMLIPWVKARLSLKELDHLAGPGRGAGPQGHRRGRGPIRQPRHRGRVPRSSPTPRRRRIRVPGPFRGGWSRRASRPRQRLRGLAAAPGERARSGDVLAECPAGPLRDRALVPVARFRRRLRVLPLRDAQARRPDRVPGIGEPRPRLRRDGGDVRREARRRIRRPRGRAGPGRRARPFRLRWAS